MLCLVARHGGKALKFPIEQGKARIGSSSGNDIVLPFPGVSREHAVLSRNGSEVFLSDLGSKNGLLLGRESVPRVPLVPGITIALGSVALCVEEDSTSDYDIALRARAGPGDPATGCPPVATDTGQDAAGDAMARALRFVRGVERRRRRLVGREVATFLAEARLLLGAETIVLFEPTDGSATVVALNGPLPAPGVFETATLHAAAARPGWRSGVLRLGTLSVVLGRPAGANTSRMAMAVLRGPVRALPAWQVDLFDYVCEKLEPSEGSAAPPSGSHPPEPAAAGLRLPAGMVVGPSPAMSALLDQAVATARSRLDILLLGETGVGKELFARMIHDSGPDAGGPFVAINCAAIPPDLLESELFGILPRSATGVDARQGQFVLADGGSIFLDEVGELAEPLQAKLLRVLQEREVLPVGASVPRKISVRVISASNRDLLAEVERHRFRADLFYRLRGLQFSLPPLRDRQADIPALVLAFVERAASEYGTVVGGVSRKALDLLMHHLWPGNIRELESEVRRAVLLCPAGSVLRAEHFGPVDWAVKRSAGTPATAPRPDEPAREPQPVQSAPAPEVARAFEPDIPAPRNLRERVEATERDAIEKALRAARGNQTATAKLLGISRNGLALKLARFGKKLVPRA